MERAELQPNTVDLIPLGGRDRQIAWEGFQLGHLDQETLFHPPSIKEKVENWRTAIHELAHAAAARSKGWYVTRVSVIRSGNVLGVTQMLPAPKNIVSLLEDKITICYASMMGEQLVGHHDHSGCGSDMAQARWAAKNLEMITGRSASSHLADGASDARATVWSMPQFALRQSAWSLVNRGVI